MADIPDPTNDNLVFLRTPVSIVPRSDWGARKAYTMDLVGMPSPTVFVLLMYTGTDTCSEDGQCEQILRERQRVHMDQMNLADIQWNFMIGGNGKVYEGRGWKTNATKDPENYPYDYKSIDVAYVGRFKRDVTPVMKMAASRLVRRGLLEKHLRKQFEVMDDMIYRAEDYLFFDPRKRLF